MQDVTERSDLIQRVSLNNPRPKPPLRWNVVSPESHAKPSGRFAKRLDGNKDINARRAKFPFLLCTSGVVAMNRN